MAQAKRREKKAASDALPASEADGPAAPAGWQRPQRLSARGLLVLGACLVLINLPILHFFLRGHPAADVSLPFADDFSSPDTVQAHYATTGGFWRTVQGELLSPGVRNNPLWLAAKLPQNVRVELDARPTSPEGDVRVELFGNGLDHLSGYLVVLGGWNNMRSAIVKGDDENAPTLQQLELQARKVAFDQHLPQAGLVETGVLKPDTAFTVEAPGVHAEQGRTYHFVLERRGAKLRWTVDGQPLLELDDPFPLKGADHDRLGLSSAEGDVFYDNLRVTPLDDAPFDARAAAPAPQSTLPAPGPYEDRFDRAALGPNWVATDAQAARLEGGALVVQNAKNHPVWLRRPLPDPVAIDFDCWSDSPDGDIKIELFGDGSSYHRGDPRAAYTATGYVLVMGGWHNTTSAIARQEEHGEGRAERSDVRVEPGRHYHWHITRKGNLLSWSVDGKPFLELKDPAPLAGPGHEFFAVSGWEAPLHFANLRIEPL